MPRRSGRDLPGAALVVVQPANGCVHGMREPGGDDVKWSTRESRPQP
jgi:hypothetical protein